MIDNLKSAPFALNLKPAIVQKCYDCDIEKNMIEEGQSTEW
ncbi:hypothetical protein AVDCRST_MAG92-1551 [uncultured Coleofasciculus sp.]|uniref:Uncharacterized protein n=1 Tax=uncultured Coleofasciculus sp. TaxID=1267456 RepID=A0A6J4I6B7_9CYAN|nr:hypothetical protein AVDCRST_MAG92-1551 [uncultured Coleofasciculus sp.]